MTLEEAKQFYFRYLGHSFHMGREEPGRFNSFRMLDLQEETLREWDEELLEKLFDDLWARPGRTWQVHGDILKIIDRGHCDPQKQLSRLLDEMEKMDRLDRFELTLVIENMAGRTQSLKDGGAHVFARHKADTDRMNRIMEELIRNHQEEKDKRYDEAVKRYRSAYDRWCGR